MLTGILFWSMRLKKKFIWRKSVLFLVFGFDARYALISLCCLNFSKVVVQNDFQLTHAILIYSPKASVFYRPVFSSEFLPTFAWFWQSKGSKSVRLQVFKGGQQCFLPRASVEEAATVRHVGCEVVRHGAVAAVSRLISPHSCGWRKRRWYVDCLNCRRFVRCMIVTMDMSLTGCILNIVLLVSL